MKNILFTISAIHVVLLAGCHRSDPHIPIDPFLVSNFDYKPGSYWIYKDSVNGDTDSFVVYRNESSSQPVSGNNATEIDGISIYISEYHEPNEIVADWRFDLGGANNFSIYYRGSYTSLFTLFTVPVQPGLIGFPSASDSGYIISTNGNYSIDTMNFNDVTITRHVCDTGSFYPHFDNKYYISTKFGIIKMDLYEHNDRRIWQFIRCLIKR